MPDEAFFKEIKDQYSRVLATRSSLDSKASSLITMSGMIATLLMGFGILLFKIINPEYEYYFVPIIILPIGVGLIILSIFFGISSYKINKKRYPIGRQTYLSDDNVYDEEMIDRFLKSPPRKFYKIKIKDYLSSIKLNSEINSTKVTLVQFGQWVFTIGVSTTIILILILIHAVISENIYLSPELF